MFFKDHSRRLKVLLAVVSLLMVMMLAACGGGEQADEDRSPNHYSDLLSAQPLGQVTVYFPALDGDCLVPLTYNVNPTRDTVWVAFEKALAGPPTDFVGNILPEGIKIVDVYREEGHIFLYLQGTQAELFADQVNFDALAATVARAIRDQGFVEDCPLSVYYNDQLLNEEAVVVSVPNDYSKDAVKKASVYFSDSQAMYGVPVVFPVEAETAEELCAKIAELWIAGPPNGSELVKAVPSGTKLLGVSLADGLLKLDFNSKLTAYQGGTAFEQMLVNTLLASFAEVPEVKMLLITIDGAAVPYLPEGTVKVTPS